MFYAWTQAHSRCCIFLFSVAYKIKGQVVIECTASTINPQLPGQGPCALRLEMDSTLTFHPMGWRVVVSGVRGWGAGLGDRVLSF